MLSSLSELSSDKLSIYYVSVLIRQTFTEPSDHHFIMHHRSSYPLLALQAPFITVLYKEFGLNSCLCSSSICMIAMDKANVSVSYF
jgi:hypothetical protein